MRVAESVYQRIDRDTGKPVPGKYEFTYRDATGRQVWQTAKGDTKADAKAERAELLARMHKGERVERTTLTVGEVAQLWLERGSRPERHAGHPRRANATSGSSASTSTRPPTPRGGRSAPASCAS